MLRGELKSLAVSHCAKFAKHATRIREHGDWLQHLQSYLERQYEDERAGEAEDEQRAHLRQLRHAGHR